MGSYHLLGGLDSFSIVVRLAIDELIDYPQFVNPLKQGGRSE